MSDFPKVDDFPKADALANAQMPLQWYAAQLPLPVVADGPVEAERRKQGRLHYEYHCALFDLTQDEDLKRFMLVKQRATTGWYAIRNEMKRWHDDGVQVWLEWVQMYIVPKIMQ